MQCIMRWMCPKYCEISENVRKNMIVGEFDVIAIRYERAGREEMHIRVAGSTIIIMHHELLILLLYRTR